MTQSQMNLGLTHGIRYQGSTRTSGVELPGVVELVVEKRFIYSIDYDRVHYMRVNS